MTDLLDKAGSGSVEPEDFNAVVDAIESGPTGKVTAADIDSLAAQDGDVLTADGAGNATWGAGGGSQPLTKIRKTLAWDTPHFQAEMFGIASVDTPSKTFVLNNLTNANDFFAPGDSLIVTGSTGNDGTYTVVTASSIDGNITVAEVVPDATGDGVASTVNAHGVETGYTPTPGDTLLLIMVSTSGEFDGASPTVQVGWSDDTAALAGLDVANADHAYDGHIDQSGANVTALATANPALIFTDTTPLRAVLNDNGAGLYPGSTQGATVLTIVVLNAA